MPLPILSNFTVVPRIFGASPFQLSDPSSNNTNPAATFTFDSSNNSVATIVGRTVTIINAGQTTIIATQAADSVYSSTSITANFTVSAAPPTIGNFTISHKEFQDGSFNLQIPSSNSDGSFSFVSLTPDIVSIDNRVVTLKRTGRAQIKATQAATSNYTSGFVVATFDVLTSIVRVGNQNRIDLSWNIPIENGATIKNYFFYTEERRSSVSPAPSISTLLENTSATNSYYSSYVPPVPYSTQILSAYGLPTGIDLNSASTSFNISTLQQNTNKNYFDLGYYGEIELSWVYHNDKPIVELAASSVASTTMTLSVYKEASTTAGDNRIDLLLNTSRTYDSSVNCYGPMPQNNNKTLTDIFTVAFAETANRSLKYLKPTDIVSGRVTISSNTYSPADSPTTTREYSIIIKSIRIAPFRFPITRDFTSLSFGLGTSTTRTGFSVSTFNALSSHSSSDVSGILYYMPKMTRSLTDYNKASWTFSWNYAANISKLTTDISYLPITTGSITNLNIPFNMRIRGYSRPYAKMFSAILDTSYNTSSVPLFLTNVSNTQYNTRLLFDVSFNDTASFAKIQATDTSFGIVSRTFDISSATGFSPFSVIQDHSHTQFVFIFQLTMTDPSYNAYFRTINSISDSFQVKMLSQTFTPYQEYRFVGPDPTLASSNSLTSLTNTLYNINDYYTKIPPFYQLFNLTNGVFYSYRIASNNIVGTSPFSELLTRRCGSIPNTIVNIVNSLNSDTLIVESERTANRVIMYWEKPAFSGYEIQYFVIQKTIDISGKWLNFLDYTPDMSSNLITFDTSNNTIVPVTDETATEYNKSIDTYLYKNSELTIYNSSLTTPTIGSLLNGYKYYFRLASVNELGYSAFSSVLSGIPFARPDNAPIQFMGTPIIGDKMVILTWKIPQDDAGSPILNYIIDYEEIVSLSNNVKKYINKTRYKLDTTENPMNRTSYPFDDFRTVYSGYKKFSSKSLDEQNRLAALRAELTTYVIPPRPITLNDLDYYLTRWDSNLGKLKTPIANKTVDLSYNSLKFTYISDPLTQNVFDISNIQLKWYYFSDSSFPFGTSSSSFKLSIKGHLIHQTNSILDISNIFDISGTYQVDTTMLSTHGTYRYINYLNGNIIQTNGITPKILVPKLPRIDSNNNLLYKLKLEYEMTEISNSNSNNRFILYSGPLIINGVSPVRTFSGLNTEFTLRLQSNFVNNKSYRFTITPFNINDFFPDPAFNSPNARSQVEVPIGTNLSEPITDMSYSIISNSQGGEVLLQWKYSYPAEYYINITIPDEYKKDNTFPQEYPLISQEYGTYSIKVSTLDKDNDGVVSYTIPSKLPIDISNSNAQKYLKSGRGYYITVAPVLSFEVAGVVQNIPAPERNMYSDGTYIIPFRTPLRPLSLSSHTDNEKIDLKWNLPDFTNDPNFYITDYTPAYYRYRYYTLEQRDIAGSSLGSTPVWTDVSNEILIPAPENGGVAGYQTQYTVSRLTNERPYQFRVRTVIINDYTGGRTFSEYTYMSVINTIPQLESSGNIVFASAYPLKSSAPHLRFANRTSTATGLYNGLTFIVDYPTYNGNAEYYECDIYYTPVGSFGAVWYGIFDVTNGIADISYNISANSDLFTTNGKLRTESASITGNQRFTIVCKSNVLAYGIKIRMYPRKNGLDGNYPSGNSLYSEFSNVDYIEI
jgi:hypothetical protein